MSIRLPGEFAVGAGVFIVSVILHLSEQERTVAVIASDWCSFLMEVL